jgi:hypothetical protein
VYTHFINRHIKLELTGLGILDWLLSTIATLFVNLFKAKIIGSLNSHLQEHVGRSLLTVDTNIFFG